MGADVISPELLEHYRQNEPLRYQAIAEMIKGGEIIVSEMTTRRMP